MQTVVISGIQRILKKNNPPIFLSCLNISVMNMLFLWSEKNLFHRKKKITRVRNLGEKFHTEKPEGSPIFSAQEGWDSRSLEFKT